MEISAIKGKGGGVERLMVNVITNFHIVLEPFPKYEYYSNWFTLLKH